MIEKTSFSFFALQFWIVMIIRDYQCTFTEIFGENILKKWFSTWVYW